MTCYLICTGTTQQSFNEAYAINENQRILVVALDDRPVNTQYPLYLAKENQITISNAIKKTTLIERIETIKKEILTDEYNSIVLSFDNLLYCGLMESREVKKPLTELEKQQLQQLMATIKKSAITAYGFSSIQRVTTNVYSKHDLKEYYTSINKNTLLTNSYFKSYPQSDFLINEEDLNYYQYRANKLNDTIYILSELADTFREFYVGKDDAQPSGIQKYELHTLKKSAKSKNIYFVNGTDEMVATLIYKILYVGKKPKVHIYYTSETDFDSKILLFEGMTLKNLIKEKQQLFQFEIVDLEEAKYVWIIHNGKSFNQEKIYELLKTNKITMLTDMNSSQYENQILSKLIQNNAQEISNIDVYCSWNTPSNMIGLTLSQAFLFKNNRNNEILREKRILKDYLYNTVLKKEIKELFLKNNDQYNIESPLMNQYIQSQMNTFLENELNSSSRVENITLPWKRLFEISIKFEGE